MRTLKITLISVAGLLLFGSAARSRAQEQYPSADRRFRAVNSLQAYPRWLNPVLVDGYLFPSGQMPAAPIHRTGPNSFVNPVPPTTTNVLSTLSNGSTWGGGTVDTGANIPGADFTPAEQYSMAVAADSRGAAHIAATKSASAPGTLNPTWGIYYYNSRPENRRANGFSAPWLLATGYSSAPDIAVSPVDDSVFVVYADGNGSIVYHVLGMNGTWSQPITLAQGGGGVTYLNPKAKVSRAGTLHVVCERFEASAQYLVHYTGAVGNIVPGTLFGAGGQAGSLGEFRFDLFNDMATVVWRSNWPDQQLNFPGGVVVIERRGGLEASIQAGGAVPIDNTMDPRIRAYQRVPDVAVGPDGTAHFTWVQQQVPATVAPDPRGLPRVPPVVYYYATPGSAGVQEVYSEASGNLPWTVVANDVLIPGAPQWNLMEKISPRIVADSRNRPHILMGSGFRRQGQTWTGRSVTHATLTPAVGGTFTWVRLPTQAFEVATSYDPTYSGPMYTGLDIGDQIDLDIDQDDQIHLVDCNQYTRTMEFELGVRDPNAMVGVFPGASVNVTNGNLHYELPLFATQGAGLNQEVRLIYNSLESRRGLLPRGWKLNYEMYLIDHWRAFNPPGQSPWRLADSMTLLLPDGRYVNFRYSAFGPGTGGRCYHAAGSNFDRTAGLIAKIERTQSSVSSPTLLSDLMTEYIMTLKNGMVYRFNANGKLTEITDPAGEAITFSYSGNRLQYIRDKGGLRTTEIEYESMQNSNRPPRISRITDPKGSQYTFVYGGGPSSDTDRHLVEVHCIGEAPSPVYSFEYYLTTTGTSRFNLLQRALPPRGSNNYGWNCLYTLDGRVVAVLDPPDINRSLDPNPGDSGGATPQVIFYYNDQITLPMNPASDPNYETVVTDRRGHRTRFVSDPRRSIVLDIWDDLFLFGWSPSQALIDPAIPMGFSPLRFIYDSEWRLGESRNRWGIRTTYDYDASSETGQEHVIDRVGTVRQWMGMVSPRIVAQYGYTSDGLHHVASVVGEPVMTGLWAGVQPIRPTSFSYYTSNTGSGRRGLLANVTYTDASPPQGQPSPGQSIQYEYAGPFGALSRVTDEENRATVFSNFDTVTGLPGSRQAPGTTQTEDFQYDVMGHMIAHRLPQGGPDNSAPGWTEYEYNGLHRLVEVRLSAVTSIENSNASDINANRTTVYVYDLDGNQVSEQPPAGLATTTTYNRVGQVTGGSGPDGDWTQTVDAHGNVRAVTDVRQVVTTRIYDSVGRLVELRVPAGTTVGTGGGGPMMVTVYTYDDYAGSVHFTQEVHGGPSLNASNISGDLRTIQTRYDGYGRPNVVSGPDLYTSTVSYYDEADQVRATETFGPEIVNGMLASAFQRAVSTYHDERGRVIVTQVTGVSNGTPSPDQVDTSMTWYDRSGRVIKTRDNSGAEKFFEMDTAGRVHYVRDAMSVIVEERLYGDDGLLIETKVPNPATKTSALVTSRKMSYTSRKELWKDLNATNFGSTHQYGRLPGQIDTATDAGGKVTKATYYAATQRIDEMTEGYQGSQERKTKSVWTGGLLAETRVYNPASGQFDASFYRDYDQSGRLERVREPQRDDRVLTYNAWTDLVMDDQGSLEVVNIPDARGLPTQSTTTQTGPGGSVSTIVNRSFNGSGMMTSTGTNGLTVQKSYADPGFNGAMGNAAWRGAAYQENFQVGPTTWKSQSYGYDANGDPEEMADSEAPLQGMQQLPNHSWIRDANGRVTEVRYAGVPVVTFQYTPGGILDSKRIYSASGSEIVRAVSTYDTRGRRTGEQTWATAGNKVLSHISWEYDDLDRITAKDLRHLGVRQTFQYNEHGELTRDQSPGNAGWGGSGNPAAGMHGLNFTNVIGPVGTGNESQPSVEAESGLASVMSVPSWDRTYAFDPGGNRTSETIDGVTATYTYGSSSRLNQVVRGSVSVAYGYDGLGNMTSRTTTEPGQTTIVEEFGYDYMNRMSTYDNSATGASWSYQHWPTGNRYEKRDEGAGTAELYVPRWGDAATEYTDDGSSVDFTNRYVQGVGTDSKAARIPASGGRRHYVSDQVGTTGVTLTDAGVVEEQCVRDAYGRTIAGDTNDERYGFAQRENDTESGLVYMRHRMYDPRIGRFTQVDPVLGNRAHEHYRHAANNPISNTDPMGLDVVLKGNRAEMARRFEQIKRYAPGLRLGYEFASGRVITPRNQDLNELTMYELALYSAIQDENKTYSIGDDLGWQATMETDLASWFVPLYRQGIEATVKWSVPFSTFDEARQIHEVMATHGGEIHGVKDLYMQLFSLNSDEGGPVFRWGGGLLVHMASEQAAANVGGRLLSKATAPLISRLAQRYASRQVTGLFGKVSRKTLEAAAGSTGRRVRIVTSQTQSPTGGRGLSVAVGDGAEALANAAHPNAMIFAGEVPEALIDIMIQKGLAERSTTMMGNVVGTELRFFSNATDFIVPFLKQVTVPK